jgi:hypothetical protein
MMTKKIPLIFFAFGLTLLSEPVTSWACSVCFTGTSDSVTDGFNASVLFLMTTPYLVVGSIVGGLIFMYRRALKKHEKLETVEPIGRLAWNQEESGK